MSGPRDDPGGPTPRRRSGRRRDALQRIPVRGDLADPGAEAPDGGEDARREVATAEPASPGPRRGGASPGSSRARGSARRGPGLDRIRPRGSGRPAGDALEPGDLEADDPHGKLALYSSSEQRAPTLGTFIVECSACRRETPIGAGDLVRAGIPSVHLPLVKRYPSFMRCPACGRRTWVRVRWRL